MIFTSYVSKGSTNNNKQYAYIKQHDHTHEDIHREL